MSRAISSGTGFVSLKTPTGAVVVPCRFERPARRRWAYCHVTGQLAKKYDRVLRWMDNVYADPGCTVPVLQAGDPDSKGRWWRSSGGALERVLTRLEGAMLIPPRAGWTVVEDAWTASAEYKKGEPVRAELRSEMLEAGERERAEAEKARALAKMDRLETRAAEARENIKKYERRQKLAATLVSKWTRKLAQRERAFAKAKESGESGSVKS